MTAAAMMNEIKRKKKMRRDCELHKIDRGIGDEYLELAINVRPN